MKEYNCGKCGGFVGEPMKAYGFAGQWCHCAEPTNPIGIKTVVTTIGTQPPLSNTNNKEVKKAIERITDKVNEYARQHYLVSEESHPVADEMKAWDDLIDTLHQELQKAREGWEQQQIEYERKLSEYYNLIHAVESKFDGETRYQTALRYIQQAEQRPLEAYQSELDQPK